MTVRVLGWESPLEAAEVRPAAGFWRRLLRKRLALLSLIIIVIIYGAGLLAPLVAPESFRATPLADPANRERAEELVFQGPSLKHPLGTDRLGRDVLSRVIWAAQTTVIVSGAAILAGPLVLGVTLGLLAGYLGGRLDNLIMRLADAFASIPTILMLILINGTVRPRVLNFFEEFESWSGISGVLESGAPDYVLVSAALALFAWVGMARIIRSQVLSLRESYYVLSARALGASVWRVLFRHLLANVGNIIIVSVTISLGAAAGAEVGLSFLGIGIQPPHPSFGAMIFDAAGPRNILAHPNLIFIPAAVIALLLFAFNLLGDALNDVLNPRRR